MDNLAYIDDTVLKQKTELINGVIYLVSPRPSIDHLSVVGNIYRHFANYFSGKKCVAFPDGADVYLDEQNRFVPDGMIICNREIIKQNGIHGAPDLVVEVLSRITAQNDRTVKKYAYAKAGVKEYWLVDIKNKAVEVYLNRNAQFEMDKIYYYYTDEEIAANNAMADDDKNKLTIYTKIKVSVCDNLTINIKDIFENIFS